VSRTVPELVSVAAVAENGVIGVDGGLPWPSIPADRRQYRTCVAAAPVILGRRTFESMRGDLPGTARIVLSRTAREASLDSVQYVAGVDDAVRAVDTLGAARAYVLGGAATYDAFQPVVTRMRLSRIPGTYDGDAFFPDWDRDAWTLQERIDYEGFTLERWRRIG
jgi:dihydrofolate reductase